MPKFKFDDIKTQFVQSERCYLLDLYILRKNQKWQKLVLHSRKNSIFHRDFINKSQNFLKNSEHLLFFFKTGKNFITDS